MRPADDVDLLRRIQGEGAAVSGQAAFCPPLHESRRIFQSWV